MRSAVTFRELWLVWAIWVACDLFSFVFRNDLPSLLARDHINIGSELSIAIFIGCCWIGGRFQAERPRP